VVVLLGFGLWPLEFSPKNEVTWLDGEKGLRFRGGDVISGRTVGGYVHSFGHVGKALSGNSDNGGISIEIWLRAAVETRHGVPSFLSFVDDSGKVVLILGQWQSSLIVRWPVPGYDARDKWHEIGVTDALPKGVQRLITVVSDQNGTSVHLNGKPVRVFAELNLFDAAPGIMDCAFVLGNSPSGQSSWSGDVFGLAFYKKALNQGEALSSFRQWSNGKKNGNPDARGLSALYLFREGSGNRVQNALSAAVPLLIPDHPTYQRQVLDRPFINNYNKRYVIQDVGLNVIGFIPLGFFLCLWMVSTRRWPKGRTVLVVVALGAVLSLSIELVQVFMPARHSSMADLVCNTMGTIVGCGFWVVGSRFWVQGSRFLADSSKLIADSKRAES
jgi:VanZ family protein